LSPPFTLFIIISCWRLKKINKIFKYSFRVGWGAVDSNAHMRNTAYLDVAADARMLYFESRGFPMSEFARLRLGPVVIKDALEYRRELFMMEPAEVHLELAGLAEDGSRFRLRNAFFRQDGKLAATLTSEIGWLNLEARRLTAPPEKLFEALQALTRTQDFETLTSSLKGQPKPAQDA
jgi:acyl-CoA thioester hydrolase